MASARMRHKKNDISSVKRSSNKENASGINSGAVGINSANISCPVQQPIRYALTSHNSVTKDTHFIEEKDGVATSSGKKLMKLSRKKTRVKKQVPHSNSHGEHRINEQDTLLSTFMGSHCMKGKTVSESRICAHKTMNSPKDSLHNSPVRRESDNMFSRLVKNIQSQNSALSKPKATSDSTTAELVECYSTSYGTFRNDTHDQTSKKALSLSSLDISSYEENNFDLGYLDSVFLTDDESDRSNRALVSSNPLHHAVSSYCDEKSNSLRVTRTNSPFNCLNDRLKHLTLGHGQEKSDFSDLSSEHGRCLDILDHAGSGGSYTDLIKSDENRFNNVTGRERRRKTKNDSLSSFLGKDKPITLGFQSGSENSSRCSSALENISTDRLNADLPNLFQMTDSIIVVECEPSELALDEQVNIVRESLDIGPQKRESSMYFTCMEESMLPDLATRLKRQNEVSCVSSINTCEESQARRTESIKQQSFLDLSSSPSIITAGPQFLTMDFSSKSPGNSVNGNHFLDSEILFSENERFGSNNKVKSDDGSESDEHWSAPFNKSQLPDLNHSPEDDLKSLSSHLALSDENKQTPQAGNGRSKKSLFSDSLQELPDLDEMPSPLASNGQQVRELQSKKSQDIVSSDVNSSDDEFDHLLNRLVTPHSGKPKPRSQNNEKKKEATSSDSDEEFDNFLEKLKTPIARSPRCRNIVNDTLFINDTDSNLSDSSDVSHLGLADRILSKKWVTEKSSLIFSAPPVVKDVCIRKKVKKSSKVLSNKTEQVLTPANKGKREKLPVTAPAGSSLSFLRSLNASLPAGKQRHADAVQFVTKFKKTREKLVSHLFSLYNEKVFDNKLPKDLSITWNPRMRKTAGFCYNKRDCKQQPYGRRSRIELSTKVCDSAERVKSTLIHELCHAAAWIIYGYQDGHGPLWKHWTQIAMLRLPELSPISRCHDYTINTKFIYRCTQCSYQIGRHSKSIDIKKKFVACAKDGLNF